MEELQHPGEAGEPGQPRDAVSTGSSGNDSTITAMSSHAERV